MHLQESGEMYLEAIYVLSQKMPTVRSLDVAEYRGYSKPSVSRAVGLLKDNGLLVMENDGSLRLTEQGKKIAEKIYERHTILCDILIKLGVSKETAEEDACKIEHHLSDETFMAMKKYVEKM